MSDIEKIIAGSPGYERIWSLIADKNQRIAELEARVTELDELCLTYKDRIAELKAWKESALKAMPDFQAIGKALGLKLGEDVSPQILPRILAMAALLGRVPHEYLDEQPPHTGEALRCWTDCPACAWKALKACE